MRRGSYWDQLRGRPSPASTGKEKSLTRGNDKTGPGCAIPTHLTENPESIDELLTAKLLAHKEIGSRRAKDGSRSRLGFRIFLVISHESLFIPLSANRALAFF